MSDKPSTAEGYSPATTLACERALVTLLRGLGTLKPHLRLIGGLVPRYLTPARPPDIPEHERHVDVHRAGGAARCATRQAHYPVSYSVRPLQPPKSTYSVFLTSLSSAPRPPRTWIWPRT
ncbi:hypothetical protein HLB44_35255 [Aquincola sp. S2]|uniref:Uncharacterized protein n=1 Tax=Pseudaquabacterium terrae TaxID=2732868 RepID=A0ABX2EUC4_9BURK|nr:hypothetical protein [Aquabacterium terrae]NRF72256.1 hypothetical protein [Aquabacterium terrae]